MGSFATIIFIGIVWHQGLPPEVTILAPKSKAECSAMQKGFDEFYADQRKNSPNPPAMLPMWESKCAVMMSGERGA
jgi:hypothetical protein